MKRFFSSLTLVLMSMVILAQPSWVKKATKSVFTLKTFADDGTSIGTASGFFLGEKGEAVSCYSPFKGASKALVVDADGKEYVVECMLGGSETYDIAKFRVGGMKKSPALKIAAGTVSSGSQVWLLPYRELRKVPQGKVLKSEKFNSYYDYYTVEIEMPDNTLGSPLFNEGGEVVGLMQPSAKRGDKQNYAIAACYADSIHITGLSINDPVMRAIHIKKALPDELDQAILTLYVGAPSLDSANFARLIDDFIEKFPSAPDGYQYRAQLSYSGNDFAAAQRDYEQALKVADKKDEVHYAYSRLIYQKEIYKSELPFAEWSLDKAMQEAKEAYSINAQPTYRHQQALISFAKQQYEEASAIYSELSASTLRSPELFYEASRCRQMLNDSIGQQALLDSAVAMFNRPLLKEAAPYILLRAQTRLQANRYRDAVNDLNDYESLMKTQVNDNFYYLRHQAEVGGRLFQQALNDITKAIEMRPDYDLYYAEKASLQIRVGLYDDALETAKECVRLAPDYSDGYLFLGLAQCLKGQKTEGLKNLQKAKDMGDLQAGGLIEKYSK